MKELKIQLYGLNQKIEHTEVHNNAFLLNYFMNIDLERKCKDQEHETEEFPLIGIEPAGSGIRYVFACGHSLTIQVVGGNKYPEILEKLKINSFKSVDDLYEELAEFSTKDSMLRTASLPNKKLGELFFSKLKSDFQKILCDEFKFCKKLDYLTTIIPPSMSLLIADQIIKERPDLDYNYLILATSILIGSSLIKLKKFCNC